MQLTDSAQEALKHATRYAAGLCQGYVGTEHILAGLIKEPTGVAHRVLEENGVTQDRVVDLIRELIAFDKGVEVAERGILKIIDGTQPEPRSSTRAFFGRRTK